MHNAAQQAPHLLTAPLECDVALDGLEFRTAGARHQREQLDGLRRQIDEVARACSRGSGVNSPPRGRFKNRYVQDVADAHDLVGFCALRERSSLKFIRLGCDKKPMVSELMSTNA